MLYADFNVEQLVTWMLYADSAMTEAREWEAAAATAAGVRVRAK